MKKLMIAAGGIVIVLVAGFFLYRHFVINSIMDGPFMENISPDERATEPEQKPGSPSDREPESADSKSAAALEPESAPAADSAQASARALPETADLVEFSWHQSAMNHDSCFDFWMKTTEENPEQPYLYCSYTDPETCERIEFGDEMFIYWAGRQKKAEAEPGGKSESGAEAEADIKSDVESELKSEADSKSEVPTETESERCPKISHERWIELIDFLRKAELSPYRSPDPQLLDSTDSKLELIWTADGQQITETFDGRSADVLLELLQDITHGV